MTAAEWLASRTPRPPAVLADRMRAALASLPGAGPVEHGPDAYLAAAEALLAGLLRDGCDARESALDLLVADALVTYAFEAAGEEPARLAERASTAMRRIASLAGAAGDRGARAGADA